MRAVSQHNRIVQITMGKRATNAESPNNLKKMAIIQYFNGGFSKYLIPSRCEVTQLPVRSIVREIDACTESTSSISEGGLKEQPR